MLRQQFVIVQKESENRENLLNESLSRIEILEKNLSESNEIIKSNDCGANRISQLTQTFRNKSGLGFLDTPVLNEKSDKPASNNTLLDKHESNARIETTPKKTKKVECKPSKETKKIKS